MTSLFPQIPKLGIVVLLVVIGLVVVVVVGVVAVVGGGGAGWGLTQHMMGRLSFISQTDFRR